MKALLAIVLALAPTMVAARDLETTHLFGFTQGSDVDNVGDKEAESETTGRFGKRAGSYGALEQELSVKFVPFQDFTVEPGLSLSHHDVAGVPGLDDRQQWAFDSLSFETRYRVLDREHAPFGLTLGADPHWGRVDDISGEAVDRYGTDFLVILDKELVADRVFGAFNLLYEPEAARSRVTGMWEHQSTSGLSAAVTMQVRPLLFIGAEVRYLRAYDGLALDAFAGDALYIGPTYYQKFSECCWMAAAWSVQVAGHSASVGGPLDLENFERHQAKLRFGYNF